MANSRTILRWLAALAGLAGISFSPALLAVEDAAKVVAANATNASDLQDKPPVAFILKDRPVIYTEPYFTNYLTQKLTPEEIALVENPLASTPAMDEWARKITAGATNDMQKARILFDEVVRRMRPGLAGTCTAKEAFATWDSPGASFCCQEYAVTYVALARATGLQAYYVDVLQIYDGTTPRHACAVVLVDDKAYLVDPALRGFGVPHPSISLRDDLEAIAEHMVEAPGLKQHRIAYKLAPEVSSVQSNHYLSLASEGLWDEARKVLDDMPRWQTDAWVTNLAQGRWALHEGNLPAAASYLREALRLNPYVGVCGRMLGDVLSQQGKLHEARQLYLNSLPLLFDNTNIQSVQQAVSDINERVADSAAASTGKEDPAVKNEVLQDQDGAKLGDAFAMLLLARRYQRGNGVAKDDAQALKWFRQAADGGNVTAMAYLGEIYRSGQGTGKDFAQAAVWLRKAAEGACADAMGFLGEMYFNGEGTNKDFAKAADWFRKGAGAGCAKAMGFLGEMYFYGMGMEKDLVQAAAWFRKAADAGDSDAMSNLGEMHLEGFGMPKDAAQAFQWFQRGANGGSIGGMRGLGAMYFYGNGVEKDDAKALEWFRKAAQAGEPVAMYSTGWLYENGQGAKKDEAEAIRWYRMAEKAGNADARQRLEALTNLSKTVGVP
jgi:uncharacterized protein